MPVEWRMQGFTKMQEAVATALKILLITTRARFTGLRFQATRPQLHGAFPTA